MTNLESKINTINSTIQKSTGIEQESLNQDIANIRAELAGLSVKLENHESKIYEILKQKEELKISIRNNEVSIKELQKESPTIVKNEKEIKLRKEELEKLEEERKKFYMIKTELKSIKERIQDKNSLIQNYSNESDFLLRQIDLVELFDKKTDTKKLDELRISFEENKESLENLDKDEIKLEKIIHTNKYEINNQGKLKEKISKMDTCPLCKNKITRDHINSIDEEINPRIDSLKREIENSNEKLKEIQTKKDILIRDKNKIDSERSKRESDLVKLSNIDEKKNQIKAIQEKYELIKKELTQLTKRKDNLEENFDEKSNIEQKYETARMEVQEISLRTEKNVDSEISFKQRELERSKISLKQLSRDEEDLDEEINILKNNKDEKEELFEKKKDQEEELSRKFKKLITERDLLNARIRENESIILTKQNNIHNIEQEINNLKVEKARVDAEIENFEIEIAGFRGTEIIKTNKDSLVQRLERTQEILSKIGTVNLRSLEVYDSIKGEYDSINKKVEVISKEKEGILRIIHEIDIKKKKTFLKTLNSLNEIFLKNFSQLCIKGDVSLELEDKKDPFEGGVNIIVKTGHGKYFDVKSLSGGEQTLVALSLIFAIQEYKPYFFYILDEIDAALDKRNSERLGSLLRKYMKKGQYIIITHNDEIITNATNLYGVSMHDGISKVISMKL
jgi:chromosome segregation protein